MKTVLYGDQIQSKMFPSRWTQSSSSRRPAPPKKTIYKRATNDVDGMHYKRSRAVSYIARIEELSRENGKLRAEVEYFSSMSAALSERAQRTEYLIKELNEEIAGRIHGLAAKRAGHQMSETC